MEGRECSSTLVSALVGGQWSASRSCRVTPMKVTPLPIVHKGLGKGRFRAHLNYWGCVSLWALVSAAWSVHLLSLHCLFAFHVIKCQEPRMDLLILLRCNTKD